MKRLRKKTKIVLLVCMIVTISLGGVRIFGEVSRMASSDKLSSEMTAKDSQAALALESIASGKENISPNTDSGKDMIKYLEWIKVYNPSEEAKKIIAQLIADGADVDALIAVCIFWEDTDEPFSIVEDIYNNAPDDLTEFEDHILWIESTYNYLTKQEDNALTIEEVQAYVESGISTSEILIANRMSRKDENDIKEILEKRQNGKSWYDLIISEQPPTDARFENINGNDLLDIKIFSEKNSENIESLLSKTAEMEEGDFIYQIKSEKRAEAKAELVQMGILDISAE